MTRTLGPFRTEQLHALAPGDRVYTATGVGELNYIAREVTPELRCVARFEVLTGPDAGHTWILDAPWGMRLLVVD